MFYIGQKVVCIDPKIGELVKGREYIIDGIFNCDKCGLIGISVGIISDNPSNHIYCGNRGHARKATAHEAMYEYYRESRFAPIESYRESFSIAMELVQEMEQVDKQKVFNPKKIEACITTPTQKQAKH